ncbi:MAG: tyrosine-type recombinase/integrase [Paracoccaceae bacterium]|nr:tyrosine-type recombinase/integrase [Paracoccaceae bacterium]
MKHVEQMKSGGWQYRRRVPKSISAIILDREFKRKLGDTEREAIAAYPQFHANVEFQIAEALLGRVRTSAFNSEASSEREAYAEALRRRADLVALGASQEHLEITADTLAESFPQDEYGPIGVPPVARHTINLLRNGIDRTKAPEVTLRDAMKYYLKEHLNADSPEADSRTIGFATRVIEAAIKAIGRDPILSSLTRQEARDVRDEMLDRTKITGKGIGEKVSAATVSRELSIITAIINFAKVEFGLGDNLNNPFNNLPVENVAKGLGRKPAEKRDPLPPEVITETRARVIANASPELALIWRLIEGTGCRVGEISGLRVEDVHISGDLPFLRIETHAIRRLKSASSRRDVPLVGAALVAAKEALEAAGNGTVMFPPYARPRGSSAVSAALMKHLRLVSVNDKHVIHSLRHNMKDRLILAEVASLDQDLILGHALEGTGNKVFGGSLAKLRAITKSMNRAFGLKADS